MSTTDHEAPLPLERFAELTAEAQLRPPQSEVLERASVDASVWARTQVHWLRTMADEARRGRASLTGRYQRRFDERRRELEAEAVPTAQPIAPIAPIAPARAPADRAPASVLDLGPTTEPASRVGGEARPPAPLPFGGAPPVVTGPSIRFAEQERPAALAPPVVTTPPLEPAPRGEPERPAPAPPPRVEPTVTRRPAVTLLGARPTPPSEALPFSPTNEASRAPDAPAPRHEPQQAAGPSGPAVAGPAPPEASPPERRLGATMFADPDASLAPATPFEPQPAATAPRPAREDLGATRMPDTEPARPAMPFAPGPDPSPRAAEAAFVPPPAAPPPRPAKEDLGATRMPDTEPARPAMPFASARGAAPAPTEAAAKVEACRFTINQFASLTAEIAEQPGEVDAIRRRYGLNEQEHLEESRRWTARFDASDELRQRYLGIVQRYRGYLQARVKR